MIRREVQCRLALAQTIAHDPHTVFCVEPITSVSDGNGERLSSLLARVVANPPHSLLVVTGKEFIFGFLENDESLPEDTAGDGLNEEYGPWPTERDSN